jgi:hypothetical protein
MNAELIISNGGSLQVPPVKEGISWELERKGVPGKLSFTVMPDGGLSFQEGNAVRLTIDGVNLFYGFVFQKKSSRDGTISVTAYDQLRYLKNKDTYVYGNKTASELIKMIAQDFRLNCGVIEDTGFRIQSRVEDNKTLFDIIQTALDLTLQSRGRLYVLYDDFGRLALKDAENMKTNILIDSEAGENYDYTSSIDGETYNRIKLAYENEESGKRDIYIAQDGQRINDWGVLQYFETMRDNANGRAKADALLSLHNQKTRNLTIKNAFGDLRVRAGSSVAVMMDLGDISIKNYMMAEKVKHTFNNGLHTMDLTLRGGEFVA